MRNVDDILSAYNIARTGEDIRKELDAAGYVIVPKEPTRAMLDAAYTAIKIVGDTPKGMLSRKNLIRHRYQAMISAANARHPAPDGPG